MSKTLCVTACYWGSVSEALSMVATGVSSSDRDSSATELQEAMEACGLGRRANADLHKIQGHNANSCQVQPCYGALYSPDQGKRACEVCLCPSAASQRKVRPESTSVLIKHLMLHLCRGCSGA